MAEREILALNESTPQVEVPQTGDTYVANRDVRFAGAVQMDNALPIASGGTGAATAAGARAALGLEIGTDVAAYTQNNYAGTGAPTVNDDSSAGYSAGSTWFDTTSAPKEVYRCVDASVGAAVWLNTTLELGDLGSMASQDANAVAITGGTIDGVAIGGTTPAAGAFTSLTAESASNTTNLLATSGNGTLRMADSAAGATRKEFTITLDNTNNRVDIQAIQQGVAVRPITLNAAGGNVSIGNASLESWGSILSALQIGGNASLASDAAAGAGKNFYIGQNAYFNAGSWYYQDTDEACLYQQGSGAHAFKVAVSGTADTVIGFTDALTIDSGGHTGIRNGKYLRLYNSGESEYASINLTSSKVSSNYALSAASGVEGGDFAAMYADNSASGAGTNTASVVFANSGTVKARIKAAVYGDGYMAFHTNNDTEKMRLLAAGDLLVGKTSASFGTQGVKLAPGVSDFTTDGNKCLGLNRLTSDGDIVAFYKDSAQVGSISITASATSYNTSSDYRLKQNWQAIQGATSLLTKLRPYEGEYKAEPGKVVHYMLAHEAQQVIPWAVTGEKDGPDMQAMDYSKLVPLLVAALQTINARTERLETLH